MGLKDSSLYQYFAKIKSFKWEIALKSLVAGIAAGTLAVIYRFLTEKLVAVSLLIYSHLRENPLLILPWLATAAAGGFVIYKLIKYEPMAAGGGVPQVEGVIQYGLKMKWRAVIAVRYAAGIIGSLFGMSFGPEGPSIQLGAAVNSGISNRLCKTNLGRDHLLTAGAAAGMSAAFGAPLTGTIFALEEIQRSFSPSILLSAMMASISADIISKAVFGMKPVFAFPDITQLPLKLYFLLVLLGIFAGFIGIVINRGLLLFQKLYTKLPEVLRPIIGILFCLPAAFTLPELLGGGHDLVYIFENPKFTLGLTAALLAGKLFFTCTSFGSGTPGGIFMPIISVGAVSGSLFGFLAVKLGVDSAYLPVFVVCAMAAGLAACVKAPVTSIVLTAEMTGTFDFLLPVTVSTIIAFFMSEIFRTSPVYEELLKRYMAKHGCESDTTATHRGDLLEIPVECGCTMSGCMLKNAEMPEDSLVVGLRRGSEELIPKGNTVIKPGDYLLVVVPHEKEYEIYRSLIKRCRKNV